MAMTDTEETTYADDDLIEIDKLLDDDTFMSIAFEWGSTIFILRLARPVHTWAGFVNYFSILPNLVCKLKLLTNLVKSVKYNLGRFLRLEIRLANIF